jgi:hypothetical protein
MTRRVLATLLLAAYASGYSAPVVLAQDYTFQRPSSSTPAPSQTPSKTPSPNTNPVPPLGPAPNSTPKPAQSQATNPTPSSTGQASQAAPQVIAPPPNLNIPAAQQPQQAPPQNQPAPQPQAPLVAAEPGSLAVGSTLPVAVSAETAFNPLQTMPATLQVTENVVDQNGRVVVPRGSKVDGNFVPVFRTTENRDRSSYKTNQQSTLEGNRFEAKTLIIGERSYSLLGKTAYVPTTTDPKVAAEDPSLKGATYGFAGGVALAIVTGGLALPAVLAGTGTGAAFGYTQQQQAVVKLVPDKPMTMTLESTLKTY